MGALIDGRSPGPQPEIPHLGISEVDFNSHLEAYERDVNTPKEWISYLQGMMRRFDSQFNNLHLKHNNFSRWQHDQAGFEPREFSQQHHSLPEGIVVAFGHGGEGDLFIDIRGLKSQDGSDYILSVLSEFPNDGHMRYRVSTQGANADYFESIVMNIPFGGGSVMHPSQSFIDDQLFNREGLILQVSGDDSSAGADIYPFWYRHRDGYDTPYLDTSPHEALSLLANRLSVFESATFSTGEYLSNKAAVDAGKEAVAAATRAASVRTSEQK